MANDNRRVLSLLTLFLLVILAAMPLWGGSAVVGTVAGGTNVMVGEQPLVPNTTLFSGDSLQVKDGSAIVSMPKGGLVVLGRDTAVSFERAADEVTVALTRGSLSVMHPADSAPVCVKVGPVSVLPGKGFKTQGDVAIVNDLVLVTAKEGSLVVQGADRTAEVKKGKTVAIKNVAQAGQVGAAGNAAHISMHLATPMISAAAAGTGAVLTAVARSKANSANTTLTSVAQQASAASTSSTSAATAAAAAAASASAACQSVSASDSNCSSQ